MIRYFAMYHRSWTARFYSRGRNYLAGKLATHRFGVAIRRDHRKQIRKLNADFNQLQTELKSARAERDRLQEFNFFLLSKGLNIPYPGGSMRADYPPEFVGPEARYSPPRQMRVVLNIDVSTFEQRYTAADQYAYQGTLIKELAHGFAAHVAKCIAQHIGPEELKQAAENQIRSRRELARFYGWL